MGLTSNRIAAAREERGTMEQMLISRRASIRGTGVTNNSVAAIPAFDQAVGFAGDAVAQLSLRAWSNKGVTRAPAPDSWQGKLFAATCPNLDQSWYTLQYILGASLTARRNAWVWKSRTVSRVEALTALHPDQVSLAGRTRDSRVWWNVTFPDDLPRPPEVSGSGQLTVDASSLLHIRGRGGLGQIVAPSPVREFAQTFGNTLAKVEHESALFSNAALGGLAVSFPAGVTKQQADVWRESFDAEHAGAANAGRTKIVGNGASISQIGMSQADAQFAESLGMSVLDMARITNVPVWFLGVRDSTSKPVSPEHEMQRWLYIGLGPMLSRIESAMRADLDMFPSPSVVPGFDTADVVRGDLAIEDTIAHNRIQDGRMTPDEWRIAHGLPPLPGGIGAIPQITPVGGAPNAIPVKTEEA